MSAVLGQLAAGVGIDELLADFPYLEGEDILAALDTWTPRSASGWPFQG